MGSIELGGGDGAPPNLPLGEGIDKKSSLLSPQLTEKIEAKTLSADEAAIATRQEIQAKLG